MASRAGASCTEGGTRTRWSLLGPDRRTSARCERLTSRFGGWAYRKGAVADTTFSMICIAIVFATGLPSSHSSGLLNAVVRPSRFASRIASGNCPTESKLATLCNSSESPSFSETGKRWSNVMLEGPAAAPRRALLRQVRNSIESNSNASTG